MEDMPGLKVFRWQSGVESQDWKHSLKIPGLKNGWLQHASLFPDIEVGKFGHRQNEYRVLRETGDTRGVIDCSSMRVHWKVGAQTFSVEAKDQGTAILILPNSTISLQGANQCHPEEAGAPYTKPPPSSHSHALEAHFHWNNSARESAQQTSLLEDQHK